MNALLRPVLPLDIGDAPDVGSCRRLLGLGSVSALCARGR
jgi:hypothetical protein